MTSVASRFNRSEFRHAAPSSQQEQSLGLVALIMCILGGAFYCYEYYLRVAPSVIQPELMTVFNVSHAGFSTLIAYYYFAYVPLQIPVGLMMDYWGPRRVLTFACLLCAVGTYMFSGTDALWIAKAGRFMVGFGSAFAYVGVLKIANLWLPRKYFAMVVGCCTTLGMIGAMSGGILMTKFMALVGWKQALNSSALLGLILTAALWAIIRDKSDRHLTKLSRASHRGLTIWVELLELIKNKQIWINGIIGSLTFLPLTAFAELWSVEYLKCLGLSKDAAALGTSMVFLGFAVGGPLWGLISDFIRSRRIPLMLGSITSAAAAVLLLSIQEPVNISLLYTLLFMTGFLASAQILVFAVGEDTCRPGMSATTVSFTNFLVMLGGMALQRLVGELLDGLQTVNALGSIVVDAQDFKLALLVLPLGLIMAAILSLLLRETYKR